MIFILKKYTFLILSMTFIFLCIFTFIRTNVSADSIRPQVNGNYDSYVNNTVKDDGYKDPADVNNRSTVRVSNANDFLKYIGYKPFGLFDKQMSSIHKIILTQDISLQDADKYYLFRNTVDKYTGMFSGGIRPLTLPHGNLVIDGQGHTLDMMGNDISLQGHKNENWTLENMKLYGSSYYGPVSVNSPYTTLNYRNIDYYGSQLVWSSRQKQVKVNIYGNVGVHSLLEYKTLKPYGDNRNDSKCQGLGNQQNMQVGDIEFHNKSKYFGESYNGNCLELYGSSKLDDDVNVELNPHGDSAEDTPPGYGSAGIYLYNFGGSNGYKSSLNFGSNDRLNVNCNNGKNSDGTSNNSANVHNSDGSSYRSRSPETLSCAFFANSQTSANLNTGTNSIFTINGIGKVDNNNSLVDIKSMKANVSGKGNGLYINSDAQNKYTPSTGVLNTSSSTINVKDNGSFKMHIKNIPKTSQNNYIIDSAKSVINVFRPKEVELSNDTYNANQSNYLNTMEGTMLSTHNFIHAKDVSVNAYMYNPNLELKNILSKDIILPLISDRLLVPGIRLMGSYFNMIKYANGLNSTLNGYTAKNFNYIDFKGTPITKVDQISHKNVNSHNPNVSGKVVDEEGNPVANSYVKLNFDGKYYDPKDTDEDNNLFYKGDDNYYNYINSQEVIYNVLRNYPPADLGEDENDLFSTTSHNFYSSISGANVSGNDSPVIRPELKNKYFNYANGYFLNNYYNTQNYNQFNAGTTTYDKNGKLINSDPYVAMTDSNGDFKFKVPQSVFKDAKNKGNSYLTVTPSYNFTDGESKKLLIRDNPLINININNNIKDITFPKGNSSDGKSIKQAFQGGQGQDPQGDTLEFINDINNRSDSSDVSQAVYTQPVPDSIDDSTLQVSYNDGKTFNNLNNNNSNIKNNHNGTKNINIKNVNLNSNSHVKLTLKGSMKSTGTVDNSSIILKPYITYGDDYSDNGGETSINFTDDKFIFKPNDIDFGVVSNLSKNDLLSTTNRDNPLVIDTKNDSREHIPFNILVQQNNDRFCNGNNDYFRGIMMYDGKSLLNPVELFSTENNNDLYLSNKHPLYLVPEQNVNIGGNYKTNLTWSVNRGIH